ncbi:gibberellin receptor GID1B-like [Cynara cardunculus var. scolymus]|uniref:gibberellin receptor GID1B-like n=1 Tax=Cynara cardunculus var. scolymus TaxID=59895 RepID=UPI000D62A60B|nr:gibberellin receptor GID1B-like [Cynara cardunculus var. scolymus]
MAGSNEINANEAKKVVPLHTWILISNFKLAYNMLRRPDGTFNRELAEFLDRKVAANTVPVDGVYSFDAGLDLVQDWQLAYVDGLQNAGQEVKLLFLKKATIGFYFLPNNEHFYTLMDEIKSFVSS